MDVGLKGHRCSKVSQASAWVALSWETESLRDHLLPPLRGPVCCLSPETGTDGSRGAGGEQQVTPLWVPTMWVCPLRGTACSC